MVRRACPQFVADLYGAFPCQVVFFGLLPVLCSEAEGPGLAAKPIIDHRRAPNVLDGQHEGIESGVQARARMLEHRRPCWIVI